MRKQVTVVLLFTFSALLSGTNTHAQKLRLNLYSAYAFSDKFDAYYGNDTYYKGKVRGGYQWGAGAEYMLRDEYSLELLYVGQSTHAPTTYSTVNGTDQKDFNFGLNYILVAPTGHLLDVNGKFEGFGGLLGGIVIANLKDPDRNRSETVTKFGWGIRAGATAWMSSLLGIKLQAQLLSAVQSMGGAFYAGTGISVGGVSSYSTIYQFSLGGGIVFKIPARE